MTEKTIYVAVDGQRFDDKEDCLRHEFSLRDYSGIVLADSNNKRIPFEYDTNLEEVAYIIIKDKKSAIIFQDNCNRLDIYSHWDCLGIEPCAGAYFWDDNNHSWISCENWKSDILKQIQEKEDIFSEVSKGD